MDSRHPVLEIEKKEGQVQRVLLADASLCSKSMQFCCQCSTEGGKVVVLRLSKRKKLFFKATNSKETDEWRKHLEAAMSMLVPPKEEENLASVSPSTESVGNVELYESWGSELFHGKAPHSEEDEGAKFKRTKVGDGELHKLLKSKQNHDARHANQSGADVNANLTRPLDVYALSEGFTTWKRVNSYQGSAVGATCVEEADEILLGARGANVDAPTSEATSFEVPYLPNYFSLAYPQPLPIRTKESSSSCASSMSISGGQSTPDTEEDYAYQMIQFQMTWQHVKGEVYEE